MFGYILASLIGMVLVGFALSFIGGGPTPTKRQSSKPADKTRPTQANEPAADEPDPDLSVVATLQEIEMAKRHTPPA